MTEKQTEALERLNRGIEDSRAEVQKRTMSLAQDYFGDAAETLKQQINENRAALEGIPDQVPGGREEAFQLMFQEIMDNYTAIEQSIGEAQTRVADLDTDNIRRQGEVDATDAARRDARELGIDLTEVEGTGSDGRITVDDVKNHADKQPASEQVNDRAGQVADQAQDVAEGAARQAQDAAGGAADQAKQAAGQAQDTAGQVAGQAQDTAGQVTDQAQNAAGQATDQVGQVAGQATDAIGRLTGGGQGESGQGSGGPLGGVTDQVGQVAGQATDQVGEVAGQAQNVAGQTTGQAGEVAGQAQDAAGGAVNQAQDVAGRATDQAGQVADQGRIPEQEIVASDAARREAREKGIDLSTVKGTGADGRIVYWDVADLPSQKAAPEETVQQAAQGATDAAGQAASGVAGQADGAVGQVGGIADQVADQAMSTADQAGGAVQGNGGEPRITKAARRKAEEMGRDLSQIRGSGAGGLITISDVVRG